MDQKHSGLGIASFITSIASGLPLALIVILAGTIEALTPGGMDSQSPVAMAVGLAMFFFIFIGLVSIGLGIAALIQKDRKKIFAILGTVFSAVVVFGIFGLLLIGLAIG